MFNSDKFGYYTVGDFKTYSKYEACKLGNPSWHFNDEVYSSIDWKIDPNVKLDDLYKLRALQIREKYDHLVLFYSGGSDSHNILKTFLNNNIKLDEIASITEYDITKNKNTYQNAEIYNQVISDIKELPFEIKFRLIEIGQLALDIIKDDNFDYLNNVNFSISPVQVAKQVLRDKIDDWKKIIESGKKLVFIWGKERPFIDTYQNKRYCFFRDSIDDCVGPYVQKNHDKGWYDEFFYWTPDMPLLTVKMAHTLKNFLDNHNNEIFYKPYQSMFGFNNNINMWMRDETSKKLLYSNWNNTRFDLGKPLNYIFSIRDKWWKKLNSQENIIFNNIVNKYISTVDPHIPKNEIKKLSPCYSKKYWIE